tara:strand:+ start:204 stop:449 length:246 start_codon:yes stop_codon:yes gene_type:complete
MKEDDILKCLIALILGFLVARYLKMEGFSPEVIASTALSDMNGHGCCISNTAGYSYNPVAVSEAAPGFGIVGAFSNPCYPM